MRVILNGILLDEPEPALHPALPGIDLKYHDGEFKFYDSNLPIFVFFFGGALFWPFCNILQINKKCIFLSKICLKLTYFWSIFGPFLVLLDFLRIFRC